VEKMSLNLYLEKFQDDNVQDLIQELKNEEEVDDAEEMGIFAIGETILITMVAGLITKLFVEVISKTEAWSKLIDLIHKIFKIGKKNSKSTETRKLLAKINGEEVILSSSDSKEEIEKKLQKIQNWLQDTTD
jgi:hypothetical protein